MIHACNIIIKNKINLVINSIEPASDHSFAKLPYKTNILTFEMNTPGTIWQNLAKILMHVSIGTEILPLKCKVPIYLHRCEICIQHSLLQYL